MHIILTGPTMVTSSSGWVPAQKGTQYKSLFFYEGLKTFFKKGIYEAHFYIETKGGGGGPAYSDRCLVIFN